MTDVAELDAGRESARRGGYVGLRAAVACVAVYGVAAVIFYHSIGPFGSSRILGCACDDQVQEVWFLSWPVFAVAHGHSILFTSWIDVPYGANLGVNTSFPLLGLLAAPLTLLAGPIASYNALLWLALVVSATSMMLVLRRWTTWWPASFVGGLLYGFSPYMIGQGAGHVFLTFVPIPPLLLLVLDELFVRQRRSSWRPGLVLGALCAIQYFISPEVLVSSAVVAATGTAVLMIARRNQVRDHLRGALSGLACALALCGAVVAYPVWFTFAGRQHVAGPPDPLSSTTRFQGDLAGLVLPTHHQLLAPGHLGAALTGHSAVENGLYLGLPLLAVLVGLLVAFRRRRVVAFSGVMVLVSLVLTLGSHLVVDTRQTGIPLPWDLVGRLPVLQDVLTARFSLYVQLFAAVVLGVGIDSLHTRGVSRERPGARSLHLRSRGSSSNRLSVACGAVAVFALMPLVPLPYGATPAQVPRLFTTAAVRRIPAGSVALFYPYQKDPNLEGMLAQAVTEMRFRIVGGLAFVPRPDGTSTAGPPNLRPDALVAVFLRAFYGDTPRYALLPLLDRSTERAICEFLVRYRVATVVVEPLGADPGLAVGYLTASIGPPARLGGTWVWFRADVAARLALRRRDGSGGR